MSDSKKHRSMAYRLREWIGVIKALVCFASPDTASTGRDDMIAAKFGLATRLARLKLAVAPVFLGQGRGCCCCH